MKVSEISDMRLSLGLSFTFMGADLSAGYKKTSDGYEIFLAPSKPDSSVPLSIEEIIREFKEMTGETLKTEDVEKTIKDSIDFDENNEGANSAALNWEKTKFCLKMLFLDIKSEKKDDGTESTQIEYALSLQIIADELIPKDIEFLNIDSLTFNIWNTQREKVLEKTALIDPELY